MPAFYTIYNLQQDIDSDLHSGGVGELANFYNTVDKGRRAMLGKIQPEELIREAYLEEALFPSVEEYASPEDLRYDDIIELKLLPAYRNVDTMNNPLMLVYRRRFDQKRYGARNVVNIGYKNGIKYVRVFKPKGLPYGTNGNAGGKFVPIHTCDSLNNNGTWNVGGNVVNLKEDPLNYVAQHGSLSFDINDSSTSGFIENFSLQRFNLADLMKKGATFAWLSLSIPKNLTSVKLVMGSNTTDLTTDLYWSTVNQPHNNNEFIDNWNLLKWMLNNLNTVGLPNPESLGYIRLEFTTTGKAIPNCRIDNIVARIGGVYEITYNSSYIIQDPQTKVWKKFATDASDVIVAEEDTYNILRLETLLSAQKEIYGTNGGARMDIGDITLQLEEAYKQYKRNHKSEAVRFEDTTMIFGNYLEGWTDAPMGGSYEGNQDNVQTPNQP